MLPYAMLGLLLGTTSLAGVVRQSLGPLAPFIMEGYGVGTTELGVLAGATALGNVLATYAHGVLLDRLGTRRMLLIGGVLTGVWFVGFAFFDSFLVAVGLFFCMGVGFSAILPVTNSGTFAWFSRRERGLPLGIKQAGVPLGASIAALSLPLLALRNSWQTALVAVGIVMVVASVATAAAYRDGPHGNAGLPRGTATDEVRRFGALLRDRRLLILALLGFAFSSVLSVLFTFFVPFMQTATGMPVVQAAALLAMAQFVSIVVRPLIGWASDRLMHGKRKPLLVAMGLLATATLVGMCVPELVATRWFIVLLALSMGVIVSWSGLLFLLAMEQAPPLLANASAGTAIMIIRMGALVSAPAFGFIADQHSFAAAFAVIALVMSVTVLAFWIAYQEHDEAVAGRTLSSVDT